MQRTTDPTNPGPPAPWAAPEPLAEALYHVRLRGSFYCWARTRGEVSVEMPRLPRTLSFHVVARGEVWLEGDEDDAVLLRPGDVALVPRGLGHRLSAAPGIAPTGRADQLEQVMLGDRFSVLTLGTEGAEASTLCGVVELDTPQAQELLAVLPPAVVTRAGWSATTAQLVALIVAELVDPRPGGETVATRLADVLVVETIRSWLATEGAATGGWLAGLRDPHLGRVLVAIHREPGHAWTLPELASLAAMSRSSFAARFTALVGVPAMRYVTRARMLAAHRRLADGETVAAVGTSLGYGSESAFSRAFTRATGRTPGRVRRDGSDDRPTDGSAPR
ncbi:AraC family transcriptional regulator [Kineococcus gynurae]|uniref:AraC family transcriptional regulator n=1 Tax=Kineococcus gynurae TaxID=452979 RepID=A0ABV5LWI3_9ACTN